MKAFENSSGTCFWTFHVPEWVDEFEQCVLDIHTVLSVWTAFLKVLFGGAIQLILSHVIDIASVTNFWTWKRSSRVWWSAEVWRSFWSSWSFFKVFDFVILAQLCVSHQHHCGIITYFFRLSLVCSLVPDLFVLFCQLLWSSMTMMTIEVGKTAHTDLLPYFWG